jgi:hypothetical protein
MTEPPDDAEEFERIPWGHLSASPPARLKAANWRLVAYGLAGAIAIAGVTAYLASGAVPASSASTSIVTTTTAVAVSAATSTPAPSISAPVKEADLMAIPPDLAAGEAAAWAEVLTEAYWTIDGSGTSALAPYLPPDTPLPVPAPGQRRFVESVQALAVVEDGPALFRVVVRASLLSAIGEQDYQRLPATALAWTLRWQREGWQLVDLPEQVEPPALQPADPFPKQPVPEGIAAHASALGSVLGGGPVGDLWRIVIAVADHNGGSWPVVRWYSPDGVPIGATASG